MKLIQIDREIKITIEISYTDLKKLNILVHGVTLTDLPGSIGIDDLTRLRSGVSTLCVELAKELNE